MLQAFWEQFLHYVENSGKQNSIVYSILKQSHPTEVSEDKVVLHCENHGIKLYLERKRALIENLLSAHLHKKTRVEFVVGEKKHKTEEPLFRFEPSTEDLFAKSGLHSKYKFDNFAVSSSNQVAFAASEAVAKTPGQSYNPLFLYGGVGVGKTHLAQSVARSVLEKDHDAKIFFSPGDQFINELIESIREKTTAKFRRKYRYLHVLIIDDIQFIAGKQTVQEEFFHTFNSIVSSGGQVILTSDRPPTEIRNLEDRLRSRFSGGLIVDIQQPDFELRAAILLIKAKEKNIEIDMEAAKIIAENVEDTRALEGTLLSLYAKTLGVKERIDLELVDMFFSEKTTQTIKKISSQDIIKTVCSVFDVKPSHVKGAIRTDTIALPRQIIMYLLRRELKLKYEEIAYILHRKDHTTVMHGYDKISKLMIKDPLIKQDVDRIIQMLEAST